MQDNGIRYSMAVCCPKVSEQQREDISDCGFQKKNKQKKYKENKLGVEEILSHQEDTENS